jgi:aspartate kinase
VQAQLVDAKEVMITDDNFTRAEPLVDRIAVAARERILPVVRNGRVPVVAGFVGSTESGITTTIGRNGSDYSASLFGAALRAQAIEIWTDVDGILTADPRVVEGARLIEEIRFDEAAELAPFGAKLHPNTIVPAVRLGIPVFVFNSRRPEGKGTRITFDAPRRPVSAVVSKRATTVVKVNSPRMLLAPGFLHTVFEIFARHRVSVDVVSTSEVSLSLTVDEPARLDELLVDLRRVGDVSIERNRGVVAVVGAGLNESSTAMARALESVGAARVHMLSLSATGINLTLVVDDTEVVPLVRRLHATFFGPAKGAA